jgi:NitT/TauT family transport system permease protein
MLHRRDLFLAVFPPLAALLALAVVWQVLVMGFGIERYVLPSPTAIASAAFRKRTELWQATLLTGRSALCGFLLCLAIGSLIGILFAHGRIVRQAFFPYAIFLQTVPIVAVAPLIISWLGPGLGSIVLIAFIVGVFPVIANVTEGILSIDPSLRELFLLNRAGWWQTLLKLEIPHAIPSLLTGARTSAGLSVIGAIVGEFFAGNSTRSHGLGFLIPQRITWLKNDEAFAAVFAATFLGVAMFALVGAVRQGLLRRYSSH